MMRTSLHSTTATTTLRILNSSIRKEEALGICFTYYLVLGFKNKAISVGWSGMPVALIPIDS